MTFQILPIIIFLNVKTKIVQYRRGREFPESTWLKFLEVASQLFLEMYCTICIHVYVYCDTLLEGRGCSSVAETFGLGPKGPGFDPRQLQ